MINFVCALDCEARPVIDFYKLRSCPDVSGVKMYAAHDKQLIVSGMGKTAAAMAVGYLAAKTPAKAVWINLGVAGHAEAELGSLFVAGKLIDQSTGYQAYPPLLFQKVFPVSNLLTVDKVKSVYPSNLMMDMEAAGFHQAAARFSPLELIHSVKVISDNSEQQHDKVNARQITDLLSPHMKAIDALVQNLSDLLVDVENVDLQNWLQSTWASVHFTHYQRKQFSRLMERWYALFPEQDMADIPVNNAKQAIAYLEQRLSNIEPEFGEC